MSDDLVREKLRLYADDVVPVHLPSFGGVTVRRRRRRARQLLGATSAVVVVALVVVLASVLGGSGSSPAAGLSGELSGGKWSLSSITTSGTVWKAPADNGFSLSFTSSGYTGNDSCNGTSGKVSYGPGTVHLGSGAMTELGCLGSDQARMQDAFRLLIDKDLSASVSAGTLTITAGQTVFALNRVQPVAPVDLSKVLPGTTWALVSIGTSGNGVSSSTAVPADLGADIVFHTSDWSASDGCNGHGGGSSYSARTITLGGGLEEYGVCSQPTGDISAAYDTVLKGTITPSVVGDALTIANGTASLTFTRETPAYVERRLTANTWNLIAVNGAPASGWTLTMTATSYSAHSKCVTLTGAVSYGAPLLTEPGTTQGRCVPAAAADETALVSVFEGTVDVNVTRGRMALSANGSSLDFSMGAPTGAVVSASPVPSGRVPDMKGTLVASTWKLQTLTTSSVSWQAIATSTADLTFTDKGYQASDGCDSQGTDVVYDESAATVDFTRGGDMSEGSCSFAAPGPPKGTLAPQAYFDALLGPLHVTLSGDSLTLTRTGVVLTFSRQESEPTPSAVSTVASGDALPSGLEGVDWHLTSLTQKGVATAVAARPLIRFYPTSGSFVFDDGCMLTSGTAAYTGAAVALTSSGWFGTLCTATALEKRIQQAFDTVLVKTTATILGPVLTLSNGSTTLTFARHTVKPAPPPTALQVSVVGPTWQLTKYSSQGTWVTPPATTKATLQLTATTFASYDGCNSTTGYAAFADSSVTLRPIGTTDGPCVGATNLEVIGSLEGDVHMTVAGDTLTVTAQGKVWVYTRGPTGPAYASSLPYLPPP